MYNRLPNFVIGFHGCDLETKKKILQENAMSMSTNSYDWLGHGIYFWEQNMERALEFAAEAVKRKWLSKGDIKQPAVIGAVIDLGNCLNMLDTGSIRRVKEAHEFYICVCKTLNKPLEENKNSKRNLDCSVMEMLHVFTKSAKLTPYDTVRAMFPEGEPLYEGAGFLDKSHIQLCVRNVNCIKALFDPRPRIESEYAW